MEQSPGLVQHIWCSGQITKKFEDVLVGFVFSQAQKQVQVDEYVLYLSTLGGDPFSAINLYNFFKSIGQKTTIWNMGNVASAGVPFFLAFDERHGVPGCSFMVHQTWTSRQALPEAINHFELETHKDRLEAMDKRTQRLIIEETSPRAKKPLTAAGLKDAFLKSATYDDTAARDLGFIADIDRPNIPTTNIVYITDQYLATLAG